MGGGPAVERVRPGAADPSVRDASAGGRAAVVPHCPADRPGHLGPGHRRGRPRPAPSHDALSVPSCCRGALPSRLRPHALNHRHDIAQHASVAHMCVIFGLDVRELPDSRLPAGPDSRSRSPNCSRLPPHWPVMALHSISAASRRPVEGAASRLHMRVCSAGGPEGVVPVWDGWGATRSRRGVRARFRPDSRPFFPRLFDAGLISEVHASATRRQFQPIMRPSKVGHRAEALPGRPRVGASGRTDDVNVSGCAGCRRDAGRRCHGVRAPAEGCEQVRPVCGKLTFRQQNPDPGQPGCGGGGGAAPAVARGVPGEVLRLSVCGDLRFAASRSNGKSNHWSQE